MIFTWNHFVLLFIFTISKIYRGLKNYKPFAREVQFLALHFLKDHFEPLSFQWEIDVWITLRGKMFKKVYNIIPTIISPSSPTNECNIFLLVGWYDTGKRCWVKNIYFPSPFRQHEYFLSIHWALSRWVHSQKPPFFTAHFTTESI